MKGILLILLFTGELEYRAFNYSMMDWDGVGGVSTAEEQVISCSSYAERLYHEIAYHTWTDPRGAGWYLRDGSGTLQGYIC